MFSIDAILKAREAALIGSIEACHANVNKYSPSFGGGNLCKVTGNKDGCDNLVFGTLVRQLQKLKLWPGNPKKIVGGMKARSAAEVLRDIKGIHNVVFPETPGPGRWSTVNHGLCPSTTDVHKAAEVVVNDRTAAVVKRYQGHLDNQKQKLGPSPIQASDF